MKIFKTYSILIMNAKYEHSIASNLHVRLKQLLSTYNPCIYMYTHGKSTLSQKYVAICIESTADFVIMPHFLYISTEDQLDYRGIRFSWLRNREARDHRCPVEQYFSPI